MPTNCQTEISETVMRAVLSWPSQGANSVPRPKVARKLLEMPQSGDRISCQMNPMMTTESIVGMKSSVR